MKKFLILALTITAFASCTDKQPIIDHYNGMMLGYFDQTDSIYFQQVDFSIETTDEAKTVKVLDFSFEIEDVEVKYMPDNDSVFVRKRINTDPNKGYGMLLGKLKR